MNNEQPRRGLPTDPRFVAKTLDELLINNAPAQVGFVDVLTDIDGSNHDAIEKKMCTGLRENKYDFIIAPEYSFAPYDTVFDEQQKDTILKRLLTASAGSKTLIIPGTFLWHKKGELKNTAYAICDGDIIHVYDKITDGGERWHAIDYQLTYHFGEALGVFSWNRLKIGIEICADAGILSQSRLWNNDVHIFISCGRKDTLQCGTYLLINDGQNCLIEARHKKTSLLGL